MYAYTSIYNITLYATLLNFNGIYLCKYRNICGNKKVLCDGLKCLLLFSADTIGYQIGTFL